MFTECPEHCNPERTLSSANIPGILRAGWECVNINDIQSTFQTILSGVSQEAILRPLLINIFINDLIGFIKKSLLYNFADDNTIITFEKDIILFTSSHREVFLTKGIQKICSKFTGEYPCGSVIPKQLYWNRASAWVSSCKLAAYFQNTFS